ncbi:MAG: hypothetical protein RL385_2943 [Pseudomonadota bacterium]
MQHFRAEVDVRRLTRFDLPRSAADLLHTDLDAVLVRPKPADQPCTMVGELGLPLCGVQHYCVTRPVTQ